MVILLAEDDVRLQYAIWKSLVASGFTVITADNGASALDASRTHHGSIDLVLTDFEMPHMNGIELCRCITAERPKTKFVVMSGGVGAKEQVAMEGLAFLQKPFHFSSLRKAIESCLP